MKIVSESIDATGEFERSPAFADYRSLLKEIRSAKAELGGVSPDDFPDEFFENSEMIFRYGPFRKVGKGSSRTAYSFDADPRYVLKFAHNAMGLIQNQTEIKNAKKGDYSCLVRILTYDPDGILIVEDNCRESTFPDWKRILGVTPQMLSKIVRTVQERQKADPGFRIENLLEEIRDPENAARVLRKTKVYDDEFSVSAHPGIVSCVENVIAAAKKETKEPKWVAVFDLIRFYYDHGQEAMIPEELLYIDQWGVKSGTAPEHDALIIIDPGVDSDFRPDVGLDGRVR